jgi:hypothetical protein
MDIPTSFIWIIVLFEAVFKHGYGAKFWGNVGINAEPLCVVFCNFVQCHIFVNYLIFAVNEWNIKCNNNDDDDNNNNNNNNNNNETSRNTTVGGCTYAIEI